MKIIEGDIFNEILIHEYDIIIQGCNCVCKQKKGIALQFVKLFQTNQFPFERKSDINKLGTIDGRHFMRSNGIWNHSLTNLPFTLDNPTIKVYNCYTQLFPRKKVNDNTLSTYPYNIPVDYEAIRLCFRKIEKLHPNTKLIMPWIGCGLAGGDKEILKQIISEEFHLIDVTVVNYNK